MSVVPAGLLAATVPAGDYAALLWGVLGGGVLLAALHHLVRRLTGSRARQRPARGAVGRLLAVLTVLAALLLGVTAGIGLALHGEVAGWALFAHVVVGGAFLVLLALLAVWRGAPSRPGRRRDAFGALAKAGFWLLLVAGLLAGGSMLLATFPWFGAERMEALLDLHRWAGLALVGAALAHGYGLLLGRSGRTTDDAGAHGSPLASDGARPTSPA